MEEARLLIPIARIFDTIALLLIPFNSFTTLLPPLVLKKFFHQCRAFFFEHAAHDFRLRVERLWGKEGITTLGVGGTIDQATEL